jgi:hypothetical protein
MYICMYQYAGRHRYDICYTYTNTRVEINERIQMGKLRNGCLHKCEYTLWHLS